MKRLSWMVVTHVNSCLVADGRQGYSKYAPYDAIYVGAAAFPLPKTV
jgi:protein-L-isoaspartate O-methyltransferase